MTTLPLAADPGYLRAARRARLLSWISLGAIGIEAAVGIAAGLAAGSIALLGFGLDSVIEALASVVIVWRFTGARLRSGAAERRAQQLVAAQFFMLAPYIAFEAVRALIAGDRPDASWVGIGLTVYSLATMPALGIAKQRLAVRLESAATRGEGRQNILCAYMAAAVLAGLLGNALFGVWWLDPAAGLAVAVVAVREGVNTWRGRGCVCCP